GCDTGASHRKLSTSWTRSKRVCKQRGCEMQCGSGWANHLRSKSPLQGLHDHDQPNAERRIESLGQSEAGSTSSWEIPLLVYAAPKTASAIITAPQVSSHWPILETHRMRLSPNTPAGTASSFPPSSDR